VARATWIVVGAVAAVGIAAAVDALPTDFPPSDPSKPAATTVVERPRRPPGTFDARGVLFYTDDRCRLGAVRLPGIEPVEVPDWDECEFSLSPDGESIVGPGIVWQSQGDLRAAGISGLVYVVGEAGVEFRLPGIAPTFRPDGALTFVRNGAVLQATGRCSASVPDPTCERVLLTRRELVGPLGLPPERAEAAVVTAIAWLTPTRLVAAVAFGGLADEVVAVYEGDALIRAISGFGGRVVELAVSPRRTYAAARLQDPTGFVLLDARAVPFILEEVQRDFSGRPPFTGGRALAWSPDDEWTAIARRNSVVFFRMGPESPDVVKIDLSAQDLTWVAAPADEAAPDHTPTAESS
jgi:hypothetical protein